MGTNYSEKILALNTGDTWLYVHSSLIYISPLVIAQINFIFYPLEKIVNFRLRLYPAFILFSCLSHLIYFPSFLSFFFFNVSWIVIAHTRCQALFFAFYKY